ncbi:MAG: hypothetical protein H6706_14270 [Myxococcales bacterium]|nr:hypothetical protein [Myxococcales bacterium]
MPSARFALAGDDPRVVVLRWRGLWRDVEVRVGHQVLGVVPDGRALRAGVAFTLLDGSPLLVQLRRGRGLVVVHRGVALAPPGAAVDALRTAGGLLLAFGVLCLVGRADYLQALGLGWGQVAGGAALLAASFVPLSRGLLWGAAGVTGASAALAAWQTPSWWVAGAALALLLPLALRMAGAARR